MLTASEDKNWVRVYERCRIVLQQGGKDDPEPEVRSSVVRDEQN